MCLNWWVIWTRPFSYCLSMVAHQTKHNLEVWTWTSSLMSSEKVAESVHHFTKKNHKNCFFACFSCPAENWRQNSLCRLSIIWCSVCCEFAGLSPTFSEEGELLENCFIIIAYTTREKVPSSHGPVECNYLGCNGPTCCELQQRQNQGHCGEAGWLCTDDRRAISTYFWVQTDCGSSQHKDWRSQHDNPTTQVKQQWLQRYKQISWPRSFERQRTNHKIHFLHVLTLSFCIKMTCDQTRFSLQPDVVAFHVVMTSYTTIDDTTKFNKVLLNHGNG